MLWLSWLLDWWLSAGVLFLLLLNAAELEVVPTKVCSLWGTPGNKRLLQEGDVIIGGLFNLHYIPSTVDQDFTKLAHYTPCTG